MWALGGDRRREEDWSKLKKGAGDIATHHGGMKKPQQSEDRGTKDPHSHPHSQVCVLTPEIWPDRRKTSLNRLADTRAAWKACLGRMEEGDGLSLP